MEDPNEKYLYDIYWLIDLEAQLLEAEGQERPMSLLDLSEIAKGNVHSREDLLDCVQNHVAANGYVNINKMVKER